MARETVFVDFKIGDTSQIEAKATQLNSQEQKAYAEGNAELEKRAKLVSENVKSLGKELQAQKAVTDAFKKQFVSAKTVGDQIIALGNTFDAAFKTGGAESVQAVYKALEDQLKGTGLSVEQFIGELKQADPATELVTESSKRLSLQLRGIRDDMAKLIIAGKENSKEYADLAAKADEYKEATRAARQEVNRSAKTSQTLAQVGDALGTVNEAAQVVVGTYALFGENSEELTATLQTLNAVMLITNGVESIAVSLKRQDSLVTKGLTGIYKAFTVALYGTSAGLTTLQAAIAATGVGALIVALGFAIAKLVEYVSNLDDATAAQDSFARSMNYLKSSLETANDEIVLQGKIAEETAKRQKDSFNDVYKVHASTLQKQLANQEAYTKSVTKKAIDLNNAINGSNEALAEKYNGNVEAMQKDFEAAEVAKSTSYEKSIEIQNKIRLEDEKHETARYQRAVAAAEKNAAKRIEIAENEQAAKQEIKDRTTNYIIESEQKVTSNEKEQYSTRLNALENSNKLRQQQIESHRQRELTEAKKNEDTTAAELLNINDKYNVEREKQDAKYLDTKKKLTEQNNAAIEQAQTIHEQNIIKAQLNYVQRGSAQELELRNELLKKQAEQQKEQIAATVTNEQLRAAQIEAVNLELNARLLDNNEAYNKERLRDATETERAMNDLAIARMKETVLGKDSNSNDVFKEQQAERKLLLDETYNEIARLDYAYQSGQITDEKQYQKDRLKLEVDAANKRVDILKAEADRRKEINDTIRAEAFNVAQELSDAVFAANDANREVQLEKQTEQLDKARENELNNANLTELQKEQINERYDAKERQLKRRAAEQDKQASIAQASINAALAITKAFATLPWPFNLIQAAAVAVATGKQIQKIRSTPLPAYAKGTKNAKKGSAIVGEQGTEIVHMKGGEIVLTHKETEKVLQYASTREMVNATVEKIVNNSFNSDAERVINRNYVNESTVPNVSIDYDKLADKVGKQFKKHGMKVETNFDKDGMGQFIESAGIKTEYLNKHYKL